MLKKIILQLVCRKTLLCLDYYAYFYKRNFGFIFIFKIVFVCVCVRER